jgi:hypothetical protein
MKTTRYRGLATLWAAICLISGSMLPMRVDAQLLPPPHIIVQPSDVTVTNQGTATFSVKLDGSIAITVNYQWQFNGVNLKTSGASGTKLLTLLDPVISYTQPNNTPSQAGAYSVKISVPLNSTVRTSSNAILSVVTGPASITAAGPATNGFHLHVAGITGVNFVVYASSDLHNWVPVYTNSSLIGAADYTDPSEASARYYKVGIQ